MFDNAFIGMHDKHGRPLHNGQQVKLYYQGTDVICKIVYVPEWAMFCLQWPDGYKNKFPMNPDKYEIVE